jgi:hypothetical protein
MAHPERFELPKLITLSGRFIDDVGYYFCPFPPTHADPVTTEKDVPSGKKKPYIRT